ncbi:MAG TPA: hypothetical protein PK343_04625 [Giesbergeria sp.]|nr:hypothetical protein [Giesbergeria sp.]
MLDHDRRHTQQAPTGQLKSQAQIDIFAIHVKTFIKSTDLLVSRAAQHQKGCIDPIWLLPECQLMRAPQQIAAQQAARCRHQALVILLSSLSVDLPRIDQAGRGGMLERGDQASPGIVAKPHIGVENREQLTAALTSIHGEGLVVVGAKAQRRGIVQHDQLKWPRSPQQARLVPSIADVEGHDHPTQAWLVTSRQLLQHAPHGSAVAVADDRNSDAHERYLDLTSPHVATTSGQLRPWPSVQKLVRKRAAVQNAAGHLHCHFARHPPSATGDLAPAANHVARHRRVFTSADATLTSRSNMHIQHRAPLMSWFRCLAAWLLIVCPLLTAWSAGAAEIGRGHVDVVDVQGRQMSVAGWAVSEQPQVFLTNIIVSLSGHEVYRGRMQRGDRTDVAEAFERPDWLGSGFVARFELPRSLAPGQHALQVRIRRGDGQEFVLPSASPAAAQIEVAPWPRLSWKQLLCLVTAAILPLGAAVGSLGHRKRRLWSTTGGVALALGGSLALLTASGLSGSSLELLLRAPAVTQGEMPAWAGQARMIRSDEWMVITPLAMAQAAHVPPWPVINHNLGEDGQNMLTIGMAGMPVAHLSTLAKPVTWGWLVFDLRHALAWAWWLPLVGGFLAFWTLLQRLAGLGAGVAAGLAMCFTLAPYSVGFSYWPTYLGMFAALGLLAGDRLLHSTRLAWALCWGGVLGWAAVSYALVLYPAWQISLATLCAPVMLAWAWRERHHWQWGMPQTLGALLAVALIAALLGSWWLDTRDAVALIRETVYPGQRNSESGGDIFPFFLFKGWLNPVTLYLEHPMVSSEAGSFQFLWLPTLAVVLWQGWQRRRIEPVSAAVLCFALFALWFQFIGFPGWLTRISLWRLVTSYRLDLALGMAQLLLLGWWLAQARASGQSRSGLRVLAWGTALAVLAQSAWEVSVMPLDVQDALPAGGLLLAALAAAVAAILLVQQKVLAFLVLYLGWTLAAALPYHPLSVAPKTLSLAPALQQAGLPHSPDPGLCRGVAVVNQPYWAMTLPTVGVPVVNSVFYVPQPSLWQRLDPQGQQQLTYNRYQRRLFRLQTLPDEAGFRIVSPRLDEVVLYMDPMRFDFHLLRACHVLLPAAEAPVLADNPTLEQVPLADAAAPYALFRLRP